MTKQNPRWLDDQVQFARLISEAEAEGVWSPENIDAVAQQMDLEPAEVCELITRAQRVWDKAVSRLRS